MQMTLYGKRTDKDFSPISAELNPDVSKTRIFFSHWAIAGRFPD